MGFSQAQKAESRKRVVETASRQLREKGFEGLGVAECMRGAGLTQGAFYGHFASRDALIVEALEHALDLRGERANTAETLTSNTESADGASHGRSKKKPPMRQDRSASLAAFIDKYLTLEHVERPGQGCALAALVGEGRHAEQEVRALLTRHVKQFSAQMAAAAGTDDDVVGLSIVTMLVGALTLARAMDDPVLIERILGSAREQVLHAASDPRV